MYTCRPELMLFGYDRRLRTFASGPMLFEILGTVIVAVIVALALVALWHAFFDRK